MRKKIELRQVAVAAWEKKIRAFQAALVPIKEIPLNTIIHVMQPASITYKTPLGQKFHRHEDIGFLIVPIKINTTTFRCRVLGVEREGWSYKQLLEHEKHKDEYLIALGFLNIRSWEIFNKQNAGLYVNWAVLSNEFKHIAFGM